MDGRRAGAARTSDDNAPDAVGRLLTIAALAIPQKRSRRRFVALGVNQLQVELRTVAAAGYRDAGVHQYNLNFSPSAVLEVRQPSCHLTYVGADAHALGV